MAQRNREREEKPGDMKHTETNKSSPFAYCCILIRWLQQSVLDVVHHDRRERLRRMNGGRERRGQKGEFQRIVFF